MKSALLFLVGIVSSAPILLSNDCSSYQACQQQPDTQSEPATPPAHLRSNPLLPLDQLTSPSSPLEYEHFNNLPQTPAAHTDPDAALSTEAPLTSSYLLSITPQPAAQNPVLKADPEASPEKTQVFDAPLAMPTSRPPELRNQDAARHWTSQHAGAEYKNANDDSAVAACSPIMRCSGSLLGVEGMAGIGTLGREYFDNDLLVVGIVLLFLGIVICVELVQKAVESRTAVFGARCRRGEIYLDDCEFGVSRPFCLKVPPLGSDKGGEMRYREDDGGGEEEKV
jgi:hypothetical protein